MTTGVVRTVYGSSLQTTQLPKLPYALLPNTTLNEKFSVQAGVAPAAGEIPKLAYWGIGNRGHTTQIGSEGIAIMKNVPHASTDAALYGHLPFVLRPISNDLSATDQAKYALRKQVQYGGVNYFAYYLRRMTVPTTAPEIRLQTTIGGVVTSTEFTPTASNLSPTPPDITNTGSNPLTSTMAYVTSKISLSLNAAECAELMNACAIIYGSPDYAIISEICACSGVDRQVSIGGGAQFNEAIAVQVISFIPTYHHIPSTPTGISGTYDLGTLDPLLVLAV